MKRATEPPCLSALVDGTILSASQLGTCPTNLTLISQGLPSMFLKSAAS